MAAFDILICGAGTGRDAPCAWPSQRLPRQGRRGLHRLGLRGVALAAFAAVSMMHPLAAGEPDQVQLTVRNLAGMPLRCVVLLAHFVTLERPLLPAGAALSLVMQRDSAAGALWLQRADGRRMMIENLLCGAADRWGETRGEVPLLPLRADTPPRMETMCRIDGRLTCSLPAAE